MPTSRAIAETASSARKKMRKASPLAYGALRAGLAVVLAVGVGFPSFDAYADETVPQFAEVNDAGMPADAVSQEASQDEGGRAWDSEDLAELWESDDPSINVPGTYVLDRDVQATAPLLVVLEEGEQATIDLAGHFVRVQDEAADSARNWRCAVDLTRNQGQVDFVDSAYEGASERGETRSYICLVADEDAYDAAVIVGSRWVDEAVADKESSEDGGASAGGSADDEAAQEQEGPTEADKTSPLAGVSFANVALTFSGSHGLGNSAEGDAVSQGGEGDAATQGGEGDDIAQGGQDRRFAVARAQADGTWAIEYASDTHSAPLAQGQSASRQSDDDEQGEAATEAPGAGTALEDRGDFADSTDAATVMPANPTELAADEGADAESLVDSTVPDGAAAPDLDSPDHDSLDALSPVEASALDAAGQLGEDVLAGHAETQGFAEGQGAASTKVNDDDGPVLARVFALVTQAAQDIADGTDLAAAWKTQQGGLESAFTITQGGTYYLGQDLETKSNLVINAPGQNVTIKFLGRKLVIDGAGVAIRKTMVEVQAAASVKFDGAASSGASSLESAGEMDVWAISSTAEGCAVSANDLTVRLASKTNAQRNLSTHAIRISSGSLALSRCVVEMDMGNQSLKSTDLINDSQLEVPSTVYATVDVSSVELVDCAVLGAGTQGFAVSDLAKAATIGNAYAVYSLAQSSVVRGGSYKAVSLKGCATCLYGASLQVLPGSAGQAVKLEADAGQIAAGVMSAAPASVLVDAALQFGCGDDYAGAAQALTALRATVEGGFVFGEGLAQNAEDSVTVLVMAGSSLQAANADGMVAGSFAAGVQAEGRSAALLALSNALPQGACALAADGEGVAFRLDARNAVAQLDDGTLYSTIADALAGFANGHTLTLLQDAGALEIAKTSSGTLDLGGHTIASLNFTTPTLGMGLTVANGTVSGTFAVDGGRTSVRHASPTPLVLSGVTVRADGSDARVSGVQAIAKAGELTLRDNTQVTVKATRRSASASASGYGVYMVTNGPALTLDHAAVSVAAASAGVSVYGAYSAKAANVADSVVSVLGDTETTCAFYAGGTLAARSSVFNASAAGGAQVVCGVWAKTSAPKATTVWLDSCSVIAGSSAQDVSGAAYVCLLGATSHTGTVAPLSYWRLSGQSTFRSAGDTHIGFNVGSVMVDPDFSLGALSDARLAVAQAQRDADKGILFASGLSQDQARRIAGLFASADGSNYEGWTLLPESSAEQVSALVWKPAGATADSGLVQVEHAGATSTYPTMKAALVAAQSGDRLVLLGDLAESGALEIAQDDLSLDLRGHELTLRAGAGAKAAQVSSGAALAFAGSGMLALANGTLSLEVGAPQEAISGGTYQGISVTGGGKLQVASDVGLSVRYVGSVGSSATQRDVALRGIALSKGSLELAGQLEVVSATTEGGIGAMKAYGVFAQPAAADATSVRVLASAQVNVNNVTAMNTTKNLYYAEATPTAAPQGGPYGLREISIDPETDPDFYADVMKQFRLSASFDDPNDTTARNTFSASIYYADAMVLHPENQDAWYNGLKVWAYSDEVKPGDVGKASSMVPTHFFVSSHYDELPIACGVATSADATGDADVLVAGKVSALCPQGDSRALDAQAASGAKVAWECSAASLVAQADSAVHLAAGKEFDLRDYIRFTSTQKVKVAYSGATISKVTAFANAVARGAVVSDAVDFTLDGATGFTVQGGDAAAIEASKFKVGPAFALAEGASACTVANAKGANEAGAVFAQAAAGLKSAAPFVDAYGACEARLNADGTLTWGQGSGCQILFKIGDAVVARYKGPRAISLAEPSAAALRLADQRQEYELVGWSTGADEHATSGFEPTNGAVNPSSDTTYYAVYGTAPVEVPVSFSNVHDDQGALVDCPGLVARYGQTVGELLETAKAELPQPADYVDSATGVRYAFVGWFPYSRTAAVGPLLYDEAKLKELAITLSVSGVSLGGLDLRAVYEAASPDQYVVKFIVDGFASSCVVSAGERPEYTSANSSNTNYNAPAKQATETGKTFIFKQWFVDADGNGSLDQGEQTYPSALPPATQDATYTADWAWKWSDVTYTFYTKRYDAATDSVESNAPNTVETTYKEKTQDVADSVMKVGGSFGAGGQVYTLRGWSTRKTDVDPLYDAANPLPSVSSSERAINDTYSRTYYGVYGVSDHKVTVRFYDGDAELGSAQVVAVSTSVNAAFAASGAAVPADKSQDKVFLGWAASADAEQAVDATSTTVETLAPGVQEELALHAVYGKRPAYTVRLRSADGSQLLYLVSVKRGETTSSALAQGGISVDMGSLEGSYFAGWRTASGSYFSLDAPVQGSLDCYASYADVKVTTQDASDADASVTVAYTAIAPVTPAEGLSGVEFSITPRDTADTPLRSSTASNGYTILKSYDLRLTATSPSAPAKQITGDFGTANIKVYVGTNYRNAQVRAFWLGLDGSSEAVKTSAVKDVDDQGYITLAIGNFTIGDEDEGGNLAIAYIEGGASGGAPAGGATATLGDDEGTSKGPSKAEGAGASPSAGSGLGGSGTSLGSSLGANALGSSLGNLGASSLGSSLGASSLGSSLGSGMGSLLGSSSASGLGSSSASTLGSSTGLSGAVASAASAGAEGAQLQAPGEDAEAESADDQAGWDANAIVFVLIALALLALLGRKLWLLLAAKRRKDEDEDDYDEPAPADPYRNGIRF